MRCTVRLSLTSGSDTVPSAVTFSTVTQPCCALHHADGWAGTSPPAFHEPPAMRHQFADARARVVGVVEVGEAEQQVAELVGADAELGVLRDGQVGEDLRAVGRVLLRQDPLVRPDVARVAGLLAAAAGVHHDEGVDVAVAVVVVRPQVGDAVGLAGGVLGQEVGARVAARVADAEVAVGVPLHRLLHPQGTDDLADDLDEPAADVGEVLLHAARGERAGGEEQLLEARRVDGELLVGEVDEHDEHPQLPAHRRPGVRRRADGAARGARTVRARRAQHPVVEAEPPLLAQQRARSLRRQPRRDPRRADRLPQALPQLRARRHRAHAVTVVRPHEQAPLVPESATLASSVTQRQGRRATSSSSTTVPPSSGRSTSSSRSTTSPSAPARRTSSVCRWAGSFGPWTPSTRLRSA